MADLAQARQLLREGRIAEAERAYEQILRAAPAETEALNFLGLAALRRQERSAALELLRRAVASAPADGQSRYHLGRALDESGNLADAQAAYQAAAELSRTCTPRACTGAHARPPRSGEQQCAPTPTRWPGRSSPAAGSILRPRRRARGRWWNARCA
ncbi:MAG: tetratricopeptide repeat protein [Steroidobacteraceae bacterium]